MQFTLSISGHTPALRSDLFPSEVARMLREAARQLEDGQHSGPMIDADGKAVGHYRLKFGWDALREGVGANP